MLNSSHVWWRHLLIKNNYIKMSLHKVFISRGTNFNWFDSQKMALTLSWKARPAFTQSKSGLIFLKYFCQLERTFAFTFLHFFSSTFSSGFLWPTPNDPSCFLLLHDCSPCRGRSWAPKQRRELCSLQFLESKRGQISREGTSKEKGSCTSRREGAEQDSEDLSKCMWESYRSI